MSKYWVVFHMLNKDGDAIGRSVWETELNLYNSKDLLIAEDILRENAKAENLVIMNFVKLED